MQVVMPDEDPLGLLFPAHLQVEHHRGVLPFHGEIKAVRVIAALDRELQLSAVRADLPGIGMLPLRLQFDRAELLERSPLERDLAVEFRDVSIFRARPQVPPVRVAPQVVTSRNAPSPAIDIVTCPSAGVQFKVIRSSPHRHSACEEERDPRRLAVRGSELFPETTVRQLTPHVAVGDLPLLPGSEALW